MNDTELLHEFADSYAGVTNDHPVASVVHRGRALRRRRRLPALAAMTAVVSGAVLVAGGSPQTGSAFARWTSEPQVTDAATAATIDAGCRGMSDLPLPPLRILDRRGAFAYSLYTDGRTAFTCELFEGDTLTWRQGGAGRGEVTQRSRLSTARPVVIEGAGQTTNNVLDQSATTLHGWVTPGVASVRLTAAAADVTGTVRDGAFAVWFPDDRLPVGRATVTAYDAAGTELGRTTIDLPAAAVSPDR